MEARVLGEDCAFEPAQSLAGLDAQLVDQRPARVLVGLQRVSLPVRAIEGQHQLRPQPLAVGMLVDERFQLTDELAMAAERELRLDQLFQCRDPQVVEPRDVALRERLVGEIREGRAAPQRERVLEQRERALGPTGPQRRPALAGESLEPVRIEAAWLELELVAMRPRDDRAVGGAERLPQPRDMGLQGLGGRRGRTLSPQLVDQPLRAQRLVGMQQQQREQGALLAPAERHHATVVEDLEGPEDAEIHFQFESAGVSHRTYSSRAASANRCRSVTAVSPARNRSAERSPPMSVPTTTTRRAAPAAVTNKEAAMGQAIPTQHPAVVLRSHYTHLRILLAIAMIAVVGLTVAVVILAGNDGARTSATAAGGSRGESAATTLRVPAPRPDALRFDGGPDEGTRGIVAVLAPSTRTDGGPEEGSRGPAASTP